MATKKCIVEILMMLSANYPTAEIAPETPLLYEKLLGDIPDDILQAACLHHMSISPYPPKISDFRKIASELETGSMFFPPAGEAWGIARRAMTDFGRNNKPEFDNPILEKTIEALGWRELCLSENATADRARFIEIYNQYLTRYQNELVMLPQIKALADAKGYKFMLDDRKRKRGLLNDGNSDLPE